MLLKKIVICYGAVKPKSNVWTVGQSHPYMRRSLKSVPQMCQLHSVDDNVPLWNVGVFEGNIVYPLKITN